MRAVVIEGYGGPEVVQCRSDAPVPTPGPGELLVEVGAAGINFMDIHTRQGKYRASRTYRVRAPCTLGMEGAGRVVALGAGVDRLTIGDRAAWCIAWGAFADYACIPAALAARVPDGISDEQAAASMFQGCTAHYLIEDVAKLVQGSTCLVHAASGSIGQILIQLAKARGVTVFATASTPEKRAIATLRGADRVLEYDGFADAVRELTDGRGVDVVFDSLGRATLRESFRATRTKGIVVNYGNVSGSVTDLDPIELGEAGSLLLTRPRLADHLDSAEVVQQRADAVFAALLSGALTIEIAEVVPLERVAEVQARIEGRTQLGKAVVRVR